MSASTDFMLRSDLTLPDDGVPARPHSGPDSHPFPALGRAEDTTPIPSWCFNNHEVHRFVGWLIERCWVITAEEATHAFRFPRYWADLYAVMVAEEAGS